MRNPRAILKLSAFVLIAICLVWLVAKLSEPRYQGKSLGAWLDEASDGGDLQTFFPACSPQGTESEMAIHAIGARGIPIYLRMLHSRDNPAFKAIRDYARLHPAFPIHLRDPEQTETQGAYALAVLGPEARSAAPQLAAMLHDNDEKIRGGAAFVLGCLGQADAVPVLEKYLANLPAPKPGSGGGLDMETYCVMHALGQLGPQARSAVPVLAPMAATNVWAQAALIKISGTGLDAIVKSLYDTTNTTAWDSAVVVAMELGNDGAPAVPALVADLQNTNARIRAQTLVALRSLHTSPEKCVPAIVPFLSATNGSSQMEAIETILAFGRNAHPWVSASNIIPLLTYPNDVIRRDATNALLRLDPKAAAKLGIK